MGDTEIERLAILETRMEAVESNIEKLGKAVEGLTASVTGLLVKASILFAVIAFVANKLADKVF